jgi:hypothetical protein
MYIFSFIYIYIYIYFFFFSFLFYKYIIFLFLYFSSLASDNALVLNPNPPLSRRMHELTDLIMFDWQRYVYHLTPLSRIPLNQSRLAFRAAKHINLIVQKKEKLKLLKGRS